MDPQLRLGLRSQASTDEPHQEIFRLRSRDFFYARAGSGYVDGAGHCIYERALRLGPAT